jgi:hypothetical protein
MNTPKSRSVFADIIANDFVLAHDVIFGAGHKSLTPPFHKLLRRAFHDETEPRQVNEAFRGGAKSTIGEEGTLLRGACRKFRYGIILGNTHARAIQRLSAIKAHVETNEPLLVAFGDLKGGIWNDAKVKLANGVVLEAFGARMSIRGIKEGVERPDFLLIDDLEDEEWVRSPDAIEANKTWLFQEVLPALQKGALVRMLGTPLAEHALLRQMARAEGWAHHRYPAKFLNADGHWEAAWPDQMSLGDLDRIEQQYAAQHRLASFRQEYLLEASNEKDKHFTSVMFNPVPHPRVWQAVFAMVDPARTTKKGSAQTGWAAWSWAPGGKLIVWEMDGAFLKPDEIVSKLFELNARWRPVWVGVEEDGLNEWLMQPVRDRQMREGYIPVQAMRAPRGKLDFIGGLQAYFSSKSVVLALQPGETAAKYANAISQFTGFPRGLIDVPNALAYAPLLHPGVPVYQDFTNECVAVGGLEAGSAPLWLAVNADGSFVTALLVQESQGTLYLLGEWVREGAPMDVAADVVRAASMAAGRGFTVVLPPTHFDQWHNVGLSQALARGNVRSQSGTPAPTGRAVIQERLRTRRQGAPGLMVDPETCPMTLNGFAAGYAYKVDRNVVAKDPGRTIYRTLLEGLESLAGSMTIQQHEEEPGLFRHAPDGRRYRSMI